MPSQLPSEAPRRVASPNPNWFRDSYECQQREDERVRAELREKIGPDGDLNAAFQEWYDEQMREHVEGIVLMLRNLHRLEQQAAPQRQRCSIKRPRRRILRQMLLQRP